MRHITLRRQAGNRHKDFQADMEKACNFKVEMDFDVEKEAKAAYVDGWEGFDLHFMRRSCTDAIYG